MRQRPLASRFTDAFHPVTMLDSAINKVVRLTVTTTPEQLERWVASLPHDVRSGIARDLDQTGEAHRFESSGHCAYYLRRQRPGAMIWRWGYVGSEREATRIRTFVQALGAPLDPHRANQVFERATQRSVSNPRPLGISLLAPEIELLQTLVPVP